MAGLTLAPVPRHDGVKLSSGSAGNNRERMTSGPQYTVPAARNDSDDAIARISAEVARYNARVRPDERLQFSPHQDHNGPPRFTGPTRPTINIGVPAIFKINGEVRRCNARLASPAVEQLMRFIGALGNTVYLGPLYGSKILILPSAAEREGQIQLDINEQYLKFLEGETFHPEDLRSLGEHGVRLFQEDAREEQIWNAGQTYTAADGEQRSDGNQSNANVAAALSDPSGSQVAPEAIQPENAVVNPEGHERREASRDEAMTDTRKEGDDKGEASARQ